MMTTAQSTAAMIALSTPSNFAVALLTFKAAALQKRAATELAIALDELGEVTETRPLGPASCDLRAAMERLALAEPASQADLAAACSAVAAYFDDAMLFDPEADELWDEEVNLLRAMIRKASLPR